MGVEQELYERLDTIPELGARIYPLVAPEGVQRPYATYRRESTDRTHSSGNTSRIRFARFSVRVYGDPEDGYGLFLGTVNRAQDVLEGASDVLQKSFIENETDDYNIATKEFVRELELDLSYTEPGTVPVPVP